MLNEWLQPILFVIAWFVLMRWILPAAGISTCMSGACRVPPKHEAKDRAETGGKV